MVPKTGLQVYTLRALMNDDFVGTLQKVAEIGYEGVEFAGYGGLPAKELANVVQSLGLIPVSSHVPLQQLESNLDETLEYAVNLGLQHVVCPYLPEERRTADDYRRLADLFDRVGQRCAQSGIRFAYHNHAFEFERLGEQYALDCLYDWTDPQWVQAELDVYWVEFAGERASDYVRKYAQRCQLLHIKDMTNDDERFYAEVGYGRLDIPGIVSAAVASDVDWFMVEQDVCRRPPLESVTMSFRYLTELARTESSNQN